MTQKELIEFCKENDPNYNKDASFKENFEPMWSIPKGIGGIGITESEFKNGFYVEIDTKGRKGFEHLESRVFYFREKVDPSKFCFQIYSSTYKKFYVPLNALENWGKEIVKEETLFQVKNEDLVDKPTVFPVPKEVIENLKESVLAQIASVNNFEKMTLEPEKTMKGLFEKPFKEFTEFMEGIVPEDSQKIEELRNMFDKESYSHEEFPIQKIHMQTMYKNERSETSIIITKPSVEGRILLFMSDEIALSSEDDYYKFSFTKERFSDLVDLMIEARKDLLK